MTWLMTAWRLATAYKTGLMIAGAVAAALGLWAYVNGLRADLAQARSNVTTAIDAANANALSLIEVQADAVAREAALVRAARTREARIRHLSALKSEIDNAPATDDGPVAPVLRRVLDGLRGTGTGDQDRDHPALGPGKPLDLFPGPRAPDR